MRSFTRSTFYQMEGRSTSPATLHAKQMWSSKIYATLPKGASGEEGVRSASTPADTNHCSAFAKVWTAAYDIPNFSNPGDVCAPVGWLLAPWLDHPLGGGGGGVGGWVDMGAGLGMSGVCGPKGAPLAPLPVQEVD